MNDKQMRMWNVMCTLSGEEVARLFLNYNGLQVLDDDFESFLRDEGVVE